MEENNAEEINAEVDGNVINNTFHVLTDDESEPEEDKEDAIPKAPAAKKPAKPAQMSAPGPSSAVTPPKDGQKPPPASQPASSAAPSTDLKVNQME